MVHLRGLVVFALFLPGVARRSARIGESHHDAQQQNNTFVKALELFSVARERFIPAGFGKARFPRQGHGVDVQTQPGRYDLNPNRNLQMMATSDEGNRKSSGSGFRFGRSKDTSKTPPKTSGSGFRFGRPNSAPPPPAKSDPFSFLKPKEEEAATPPPKTADLFSFFKPKEEEAPTTPRAKVDPFSFLKPKEEEAATPPPKTADLFSFFKPEEEEAPTPPLAKTDAFSFFKPKEEEALAPPPAAADPFSFLKPKAEEQPAPPPAKADLFSFLKPQAEEQPAPPPANSDRPTFFEELNERALQIKEEEQAPLSEFEEEPATPFGEEDFPMASSELPASTAPASFVDNVGSAGTLVGAGVSGAVLGGILTDVAGVGITGELVTDAAAVAAVLTGVGAAYAATRPDEAGEAARFVGGAVANTTAAYAELAAINAEIAVLKKQQEAQAAIDAKIAQVKAVPGEVQEAVLRQVEEVKAAPMRKVNELKQQLAEEQENFNRRKQQLMEEKENLNGRYK